MPDPSPDTAARPRLLDLFCGAGGSAVGYRRAGFDVVGVDIEPQPHYPFEFIQGDAFRYLTHEALIFDAIHASPPCQEFTVYRNARPGSLPRWPDLIDATRDLLVESGLPWIMENVPGAPMTDTPDLFGAYGTSLCGTSFGIPIRRHRIFESSFHIPRPQCRHAQFTERRFPGSSNRPNGRTVCNVGEYRVPLKVQKECMEVDWDVTLHELSEMIPPKYTEFIGTQLLRHLAKAEVKS
jgi:DNA (cytosine-5)-methyltransferase 1